MAEKASYHTCYSTSRLPTATSANTKGSGFFDSCVREQRGRRPLLIIPLFHLPLFILPLFILPLFILPLFILSRLINYQHSKTCSTWVAPSQVAGSDTYSRLESVEGNLGDLVRLPRNRLRR